METNRKGGRPRRRAPVPGERVSLGLRVTPEMKARLDAEARRSGRSQSQEAELRLEQSFRNDNYADQAMDLAYGLRLTALLKALGRVMVDAGPVAAMRKTGRHQDAVNWMSNAYAFDQAAEAVATVLEALQPEGDKTAPNEIDNRLGEMMATGALIAIKDRECGGELGDWARPVRERFGEIVDRIRVDPNAQISVNLMPPQIVEGGHQAESRILDTHMGRSLGRAADEDQKERN
jgi:TraY domain